MEMLRFTRTNDMVAELDIFWRAGIALLALEQITYALLTGGVMQNFEA